MAAEETEWVTFFSGSDTDDDDKESLSFSNLPISDKPTTTSSPSKDEHFEFHTLGNSGDTPSPELLFSNGQLLPPISRSISSSTITLDNSSSSNSNSNSNSSSCVISRSVSSSSSDARPQRRRSSSAFYAYPSPSPRVTPVRRSGFGGGGGSGRRSTGTAPPAGWGLLRLGVVMAPEMELRDIRFRGSGKLMRGGCVMEDREKSTVWRLLGGGLTGCRCSPEDVVVGKKKKKQGGVGSMRERKERMFEWLDELSLGKEPLIG